MMLQRSSQTLIHVRSLEHEAVLQRSKDQSAWSRRPRDASRRGCRGFRGVDTLHKALDQAAQGDRRYVEPKPIPGPPARKGEALDRTLPGQVKLNPDLTLDEHCELFKEVHSVKVSNATMSRAFKRLKLPLKKSVL